MKHEIKGTLWAHGCILSSCIVFGLMAPIGKAAMNGGISGMDMVAFRLIGGTVLFWIASLFIPGEHLPLRHILLLLPAGLCGLVFSQCCFLLGLNWTSPVNASIETTTQPIFSLALGAWILKEHITFKKIIGLILGFVGAGMLILASGSLSDGNSLHVRGDLLCLAAQLSFALYLTLFARFIRQYHLFTVNKWMFTYATLLIVPFTWKHLAGIHWSEIGIDIWLEIGYIAVFCSFIGYSLLVAGQKRLSPLSVSIYNYVQPVVAIAVSIGLGLAAFGWKQAVASAVVFLGVWLVISPQNKLGHYNNILHNNKNENNKIK